MLTFLDGERVDFDPRTGNDERLSVRLLIDLNDYWTL